MSRIGLASFIPRLILQSRPGIASLLPIALYTIFLYLLTNAEIVGVFPRHVKNLITVVSIFCILAIVAFNEIAAFTAVSIRESSSHHLLSNELVVTGSQGTS